MLATLTKHVDAENLLGRVKRVINKSKIEFKYMLCIEIFIVD
ncbi:hypothetical protein E23_00062 [Faustovirus]|nr:hypothetical protein E23_00062 [Faustovirus]